MSNIVLLIANNFPPPINGGNMRVYKFSKYLSKHGYRVIVICNAVDKLSLVKEDPKLYNELYNVEFISVPNLVYRLTKVLNSFKRNKNVSKIANNHNASTNRGVLYKIYTMFDRFLVPDIDRYLWAYFAYNKAKKVIINYKIRNVITSSPPHSSQLIGHKLKSEFGDTINWISDFRDFWSLSHIFDLKLAYNRRIHLNLERKVLTKADHIIFVSEGIKDETIKFFTETDISKKAHVITNGYDEDDFINLPKPADFNNEAFNISYVGSLYGPQTKSKLVEAIQLFQEDNKDLNVQFNFIGQFQDDISRKLESIIRVKIYPHMSHRIALGYMSYSDILLLHIPNSKEGSIAHGTKFFEYLRIGKPILAIAPEGEASKMIMENSIGSIVNPDNAEEISYGLYELYTNIKGSKLLPKNDIQFLNKFNRDCLTKKLENILNI